jgi:hypothetical protein
MRSTMKLTNKLTIPGSNVSKAFKPSEHTVTIPVKKNNTTHTTNNELD